MKKKKKLRRLTTYVSEEAYKTVRRKCRRAKTTESDYVRYCVGMQLLGA